MATLTSKLIVSLQDMVSGPARGIGAAIDRLNAKARGGSALLGGGAFAGNAVRNLLAVGAGYVSLREGIGGTVGAAIKFEEAFADVRKVVDGTPAQLSAMRSEILNMSKTLPVTAEGIAAIYAAAGQSNVPLAELGKFSEMAAKVSVAWDISQGETGEALAKIKTQLGLTVSELGLYADAVNHLSNNTASAAPDLVDFAKRVAATGKMFGFQSTETLAFGAAMVSAGAESEVAATSFRNMGRALTKGSQATKAQRTAFTRLGLDAVKTAKGMQKNALKTTLDVIDRIQKLPEYEHNSIASALFGDEARALMPIIADTRELRRELGLVATEADYAGSAFDEYMVRSETAANALQLIGNKFRARFIGIGDSWLPTIKELGLGIGDVLDTLDKRVGVLDQIKASMTGLMGGLGYGGTGGARELINDLGDLLFGKAFEGQLRDADERVIGLARLSNRFRGIGQDLRAFADDVTGGNIGAAIGSVGDALSSLDGSMTVGGAIAIGATGWALLALGRGALALTFSKAGQVVIMAMAVSSLINAAKEAGSLGDFIDNLGELSAIDWAVISAGALLLAGRVGRLAGAASRLARSLGLISAAGGVAALAGGAAAPGSAPGGKGLPGGPWLTPFGTAALAAAGVAAIGAAIATYGPDVAKRSTKPKEGTPGWWLGMDPTESRQDRLDRLNTPDRDDGPGFWKRLLLGKAADPDFSFRDHMKMSFGGKDAGGPSDVNLVGVPDVSIPAPVTIQPSGTQDVRVTNPMPAPIINITLNATTNASPADILATVKSGLSAELNAMSRGAYSDGAN